MAYQLLSVSIFCFICATHSPCASHAEIGHVDLHQHDNYKDPSMPWLDQQKNVNLREKLSRQKRLTAKSDDDPASTEYIDKNSHYIERRDLKNNSSNQKFEEINTNLNKSEEINNITKTNSTMETELVQEADISQELLQKLFLNFGDGENMTKEGLDKIFKKIDRLKELIEKDFHDNVTQRDAHDHNHIHSHERHDSSESINNHRSNKCLKPKDLLGNRTSDPDEKVDQSTFSEYCPVLLSYIISDLTCQQADTLEHQVAEDINVENSLTQVDSLVWLYSILAVVLISICGILALVIIPVMQKRFYKPLIQFLVALAVGTLAGDALLHLLPHAMGASHNHGEESEEDLAQHNANTWKGFVAMLGLTFFFIMERLILLAGKWRKQKQKDSTLSHAHVKVLNDQGEKRADTQCMDRYNPSPYCYKDIMNDAHSNFLPQGRSATTVLELLGSNNDLHSMRKSRVGAIDKCEANSNNVADVSSPCIEAKMLPPDHEDYTVIVREHSSNHHGHSHKHGHVHAAPQDFSSVAWMVIMGDGLHNFTDGMAIGAAFSSGLAGGFSTTVAVFCHELPHELGDFAMLLKAGMSIKQALFYNMLSSILCILGNLFGVWLGNTESANSWVFAAAAGTFIYIALVDMIPELTSAHEDEDNLLQCVLHLSGLLLGFGIMTIIALYEHDLKHLFHEE